MSDMLAPYLPLLKAKDGECKALIRLSESAKARITPFFDIARPNVQSGSEFAKQLNRSTQRIATAWASERKAFVDLFDIPLTARLDSGIHPVTACFQWLAERGVHAVPVYGFDRDPEYLRAISDLPNLKEVGLCLRLIEQDDFDHLDELPKMVLELISQFGLSASEVDVVVDLRSISARQPAVLRARLLTGISNLVSAARFRSITVVGSNYLRDVSPIPRDSEAFVQRAEYQIWKDVAAIIRRDQFVRFGDYGIVHPDFVELGPVPNANAKIRYTTADSWLVLRGHSLRDAPGYAQYRELAARLAAYGVYRGPAFSWGDQYVADCANGLAGTGNLRTWVTVDTVHHLELVCRQVERQVRVSQLDVTS